VNKTLIGAGYKLQQKLALIGNNFLKVPVLNNPLLGIGRNLVNKLDDNFFDTKLKITGAGKWTLMWANLVDEATNFKPKADLDNFFGNQIFDETYEFLRNAFVIAKKKNFNANVKSESLKDFFNRHKPTSIAKKIRLILDRDPGAEKI
jgi:hypothetical protein